VVFVLGLSAQIDGKPRPVGVLRALPLHRRAEKNAAGKPVFALRGQSAPILFFKAGGMIPFVGKVSVSLL
jgi:hypothetical protein